MLRGINVGGRNRVAMPELRAVVESLGYSEVRTYVQSGNVIFSGSGRTTTVAGRLAAGLRDDLDVDAAVVVRTGRELADVRRANPFVADGRRPDDEPTAFHVTFLAGVPDRARWDALAADAARFAPDACRLVGLRRPSPRPRRPVLRHETAERVLREEARPHRDHPELEDRRRPRRDGQRLTGPAGRRQPSSRRNTIPVAGFGLKYVVFGGIRRRAAPIRRSARPSPARSSTAASASPSRTAAYASGHVCRCVRLPVGQAVEGQGDEAGVEVAAGRLVRLGVRVQQPGVGRGDEGERARLAERADDALGRRRRHGRRRTSARTIARRSVPSGSRPTVRWIGPTVSCSSESSTTRAMIESWSPGRSPLASRTWSPVGAGRLVAVVAVGDDDRRRGDRVGHRGDRVRVVDHPELVAARRRRRTPRPPAGPSARTSRSAPG